jgi:muramidase (phage lysozyme)
VALIVGFIAVAAGTGSLSGCASSAASFDSYTPNESDPDFDIAPKSPTVRGTTNGRDYDEGTILEVMTTQLSLREEKGGVVLTSLPKGTRVAVWSKSGADGWVHVTARGNLGFVAAAYVRPVLDEDLPNGDPPPPEPVEAGGSADAGRDAAKSSSGTNSSSSSGAPPAPSAETCHPSRGQNVVNRFQKGLHDAIGFAEGTKDRFKDGYDVGFAYKIFTSCKAHPNIRTCSGICSTAAGRYQFLKTTWDGTARAIGATNFEPENQERGAEHLVKTVRRASVSSTRAMTSTEFTNAMNKLSYEWASLPPGRYGQPIKTMTQMRTEYCKLVPGGC